MKRPPKKKAANTRSKSSRAVLDGLRALKARLEGEPVTTAKKQPPQHGGGDDEGR